MDPKKLPTYSMLVTQSVVIVRRVSQGCSVTPQRNGQIWLRALKCHEGYGPKLVEQGK